MPKAARIGDSCSGHNCFPSTPILSGSPDVLINFLPAARKGDPVSMHICPCPAAPPGVPPIQHGVHNRSISEGSSNVFINDKAAARVGDSIGCGGSISVGSSNVFVGDTPYKSDVHDCVKAAVRNNEAFIDPASLASNKASLDQEKIITSDAATTNGQEEQKEQSEGSCSSSYEKYETDSICQTRQIARMNE